MTGGNDNIAAKWQIAQWEAGSPGTDLPESVDAPPHPGWHDADVATRQRSHCEPGSATIPRWCPGRTTFSQSAWNSSTTMRAIRDCKMLKIHATQPPDEKATNCNVIVLGGGKKLQLTGELSAGRIKR